jgi:hypothetical protein
MIPLGQPPGEASSSGGLSPEISVELRGWVFKIFQEIHGVMTGLANKDGPPDDITGTPPSVADLED